MIKDTYFGCTSDARVCVKRIGHFQVHGLLVMQVKTTPYDATPSFHVNWPKVIYANNIIFTKYNQ